MKCVVCLGCRCRHGEDGGSCERSRKCIRRGVCEVLEMVKGERIEWKVVLLYLLSSVGSVDLVSDVETMETVESACKVEVVEMVKS